MEQYEHTVLEFHGGQFVMWWVVLSFDVSEKESFVVDVVSVFGC